jgi:predicted PurR-regulated permease PerM
MADPRQRYSSIASFMLAGIGLLLVLQLHLLAALMAGLLVYEVIDTLTPRLQKLLAGERARWLAVALLAALVIGLLVLAIFGGVAFFRSEIGSTGELYQRLMPILDQARAQLPPWIVNHLPDSTEEVRVTVTEWLRSHAAQLQLAGKETARVLAQLLVGMVLGALIALHAARGERNPAPLARALSTRSDNLSQSFHDVVFAQVKISLLNTAFTAAFLLIVLPAFSVHLPLAKTLVLITFVAGLLPVIGNLISNTLVVVVALSVSMWVALAALVFLIAIHKLEYFLNARIVGTQIRARAWELLLAMLAMEAAFGLPGVVAAPVYYAFLKRELRAAELV